MRRDELAMLALRWWRWGWGWRYIFFVPYPHPHHMNRWFPTSQKEGDGGGYWIYWREMEKGGGGRFEWCAISDSIASMESWTRGTLLSVL